MYQNQQFQMPLMQQWMFGGAPQQQQGLMLQHQYSLGNTQQLWFAPQQQPFTNNLAVSSPLAHIPIQSQQFYNCQWQQAAYNQNIAANTNNFMPIMQQTPVFCPQTWPMQNPTLNTALQESSPRTPLSASNALSFSAACQEVQQKSMQGAGTDSWACTSADITPKVAAIKREVVVLTRDLSERNTVSEKAEEQHQKEEEEQEQDSVPEALIEDRQEKFSTLFQEAQQQQKYCKNIVKNIVKAFYKMVYEEDCEEELQTIVPNDAGTLAWVRLRLSSYIKRRNFNNQLVRDLLQHERFSPFFLHFLTAKSSDWIAAASFDQKDVYKKIVQTYLKLASQNHSQEDDLLARKKCRRYKK